MFNLKRISEKFHADFLPYRDMRMGIYGTGNNARAVLQNAGNFQISCVIVKNPSSSSFFGKPIVSLEDAIASGIEMVVLAAESDIEVIIYDRIADTCHKNHIRVFGLHLGDMETLFAKQMLHGFRQNEYVTKSFVMEQIDAHTVISFDIFDTLLMRKTLSPQDVFFIVQARAEEAGIQIHDFLFQRIHAELTNPQSEPTLDEIYDYIQEIIGLSAEDTEKLKQIEISTERDVLIPREGVCELYRYAKQSGKQLYLISDMYLSKDILQGLLSESGISGYDDIFISSEYRTAKNDDLYEELLKHCRGKNCLHIGDHPKLDGLNAVTHGLDAIVLPSALELLKRSQYKDVLLRVSTINERSLLGLFVLRMFGDPFVKNLHIEMAEEYGYLFLGPLMSAYMVWLIETIRKEHLTKILFAARDGFLFQRLYQLAGEILNDAVLPEGIYFYTSRKACFRAYCRDEDGLQEILRQYTFTMDDVSRNFSGGGNGGSLPKEEIYMLAKKEHEGYGRYIRSLGLSGTDRIGFVDLVSGGTCQYYLEKMFLPGVTGLYFCQIVGMVKSLPLIYALMREHAADPAAYFSKIDQLVLLEAVMTSPEPSLAGFTKSGEPVFLPKSLSEEDDRFVAGVQDGIAEFFKDFLQNLYVEGGDIHLSVLRTLFSYRNVADVDMNILSHIFLEDELIGVSFGERKSGTKDKEGVF